MCFHLILETEDWLTYTHSLAIMSWKTLTRTGKNCPRTSWNTTEASSISTTKTLILPGQLLSGGPTNMQHHSCSHRGRRSSQRCSLTFHVHAWWDSLIASSGCRHRAEARSVQLEGYRTQVSNVELQVHSRGGTEEHSEQRNTLGKEPMLLLLGTWRALTPRGRSSGAGWSRWGVTYRFC